MDRARGRDRGGILGLGHLLRTYGAAVEAGLAAHYPGVRLAQLWQGTLTPRQLIVYLRHLPLNSPLGVALHGDAARWGPAEHLLAVAIDVLQGANWQRGGGRGSRPQPIKRPDPRAEKRRREYVARLKRLGHI